MVYPRFSAEFPAFAGVWYLRDLNTNEIVRDGKGNKLALSDSEVEKVQNEMNRRTGNL